MKSKITLLVVLCFAFHYVKAQYHDAKWVLCYGIPGFQSNVIIDFNNGQTPQVGVTNSYVPMNIENASISDSLGNLLFFTNGTRLFDRNLNFIPGGNLTLPFDTNGAYFGLVQRQGCMFLPWPGDTNRYVLLHTTKELRLPLSYPGWVPDDVPTHLYTTLLDRTFNGGNGGIVSINQVILTDTLTNWAGGLSVTKHANGRDWWIIVKKHYRNKFFKFLLTPSGIQYIGFQNIGLDNQPRVIDSYSFSPNGEILGGVIGGHEIALFNFDRCTGILSNYQTLNNPPTTNYGCIDIDFSSNSKVLYTNERAKIFQYDLTGINIPGAVQATRIVIADTSFTTLLCDSPGPAIKNLYSCGALAADGKIYFPTNSACPELTYIDYPDSIGMSCSFNYVGINIINLSTICIPYFTNYRLGPVSGSMCDSLGVGISEIQHDFHFGITPNPVSNETVKMIYLLPQNQGGELTIFNITGQVVYRQHLPPWSTLQYMDVSHLGGGVYSCVIRSGANQVVKKLVITGNR